MSLAELSQWVVIFILSAGVVVLWINRMKPVKDDPRLSKGLQLLQSKIAVLEDLADRTDTQVQQLTALLDRRARDFEDKIAQSDRVLLKIEQSLKKTQETARLFQDRIPHQEIIERQNTIKYVKAARMAHQGVAIHEISQQVDLTPAEIEFIAKVNKEQLMFCEESLPEWVENSASHTSETSSELEWPSTQQKDPREWVQKIQKSSEPSQALKTLSEKFQQAIKTGGVSEPSAAPQPRPVSAPVAPAPAAAAPSPAAVKVAVEAQGESVVLHNGKTAILKPFEFKKIDIDKNLG